MKGLSEGGAVGQTLLSRKIRTKKTLPDVCLKLPIATMYACISGFRDEKLSRDSVVELCLLFVEFCCQTTASTHSGLKTTLKKSEALPLYVLV